MLHVFLVPVIIKNVKNSTADGSDSRPRRRRIVSKRFFVGAVAGVVKFGTSVFELNDDIVAGDVRAYSLLIDPSVILAVFVDVNVLTGEFCSVSHD